MRTHNEIAFGNVTKEDIERGFSWEFLRCQASDTRYKMFTFNGRTPPKGVEGDELDRTGGFARIENAGLQRLMKETIADPKMRAFVSSLHGLKGFPSFFSNYENLVQHKLLERDLGYGMAMDFITDKNFMGRMSETLSQKYELTVQQEEGQGQVLYIRQSVNLVPELATFLMRVVKEDVALSKNEFSLTMKIPLDQNMEGDAFPKYEITAIEQSVEDGTRIVYHPDSGVCEQFDPDGNRTVLDSSSD